MQAQSAKKSEAAGIPGAKRRGARQGASSRASSRASYRAAQESCSRATDAWAELDRLEKERLDEFKMRVAPATKALMKQSQPSVAVLVGEAREVSLTDDGAHSCTRSSPKMLGKPKPKDRAEAAWKELVVVESDVLSDFRDRSLTFLLGMQ